MYSFEVHIVNFVYVAIYWNIYFYEEFDWLFVHLVWEEFVVLGVERLASLSVCLTSVGGWWQYMSLYDVGVLMVIIIFCYYHVLPFDNLYCYKIELVLLFLCFFVFYFCREYSSWFYWSKFQLFFCYPFLESLGKSVVIMHECGW